MNSDQTNQTGQNKTEKKASDKQEKKPPFDAEKYLRNLTEGEQLPREDDYTVSSDSDQE